MPAVNVWVTKRVLNDLSGDKIWIKNENENIKSKPLLCLYWHVKWIRRIEIRKLSYLLFSFVSKPLNIYIIYIIYEYIIYEYT